VVPLLVAAHLHELGKLKQACIDLIKAKLTASAIFDLLADLETDQPLLWTETLVALGLHAEEKEEPDALKELHK
jgi:hypothetical protein